MSVGFIWSRRRNCHLQVRPVWLAVAPLLLLGLLLAASCGSSPATTVPPIRTPAGNYTVTVLASSSAITHRLDLGLAVQ